jgi:hypothetical protein|tara:strand:+ start:495 stop:797 length:303 start_codon:yes stop_codon:yes gene_type:complete
MKQQETYIFLNIINLALKSNNPSVNDPLFQECLEKAEGDNLRALAIYNHRKSNLDRNQDDDLDHREKWPMLAPLLILYTLGTIGVLALVFGFLASRLNWW